VSSPLSPGPPGRPRKSLARSSSASWKARRSSGTSPSSQEVRRGSHAGRAGQGRQAPAGGAAAARAGGPHGRQAAQGDREVRRAVAPGFHRARRQRERQPHCLHGQDPDVRLHREQGGPLPRQGLAAKRRRQALHHLPAQGLRWSDGQPFTADDFLFWYEDIYQNRELVPTAAPEMQVNGKSGRMYKRDDYTVVFEFPDPYFLFVDILAGDTLIGGGQATQMARSSFFGAYARPTTSSSSCPSTPRWTRSSGRPRPPI